MKVNYTETYPFKPIHCITPMTDYWQNGTWKFGSLEITPDMAYQPSFIDIILKGNTALTLVNAKADGLNYLKLFGNTEQRNLPEGYTEYDGLIGDGTAYIDIDCAMDQDDELIVEFAKKVDAARDIAGYRDAASSNNISAIIASTGNSVADFNNSDYSPYRMNVAISANTRYKVVINKTGRYLYDMSGTLLGSNTTACTDTISCPTCYLFKLGGSGLANKFEGTIYRAIIKGKRDVVPCSNGTTYGVYDKLNGVFYPNANTEGSFTVGNAVTPSPDTHVDIVCNNGVVKYSANMANMIADNLTIGYYISAQGVVSASEYNFIYNKYIPVKPNTTYTLSFSDILYFASISEYSTADDSGFIRRNTYSSGSGPFIITSCTLTTGATTNYIRFGSNMYKDITLTNDIVLAVNYMLTQSDTPQTYRPYGQIYTDGTTEKVEIFGKNLFNPNTTVPHKYINSSGDEIDSYSTTAWLNHTDYIKVIGGESYTLSVTNTDGGTNTIAFNWFDINKTILSTRPTKQVNTSSYTFTNTAPANAEYLIVNYIDGSNKQLEQGSTATTYEPYFYGGSATAEPLYKVGTYQDVQSVLDGAVTRNIGIKVLDGTESWQNISGYFNLSKTYLGSDSTVMPNNSTNIICSHFETKTGAFTNGIGIGGSYVNFKYDSIATTLTAWKQWLQDQYNAGTPVIVIYPLATATTESVTPQQLTIQQGTNIVEITQASINDLELEVSYKAGVTVTITEVENAQLDNNVEVTIQ